MKQIFLTIAILLTTTISAEEVKIAEFYADEVYSIESQFKFNSELNRAWVESTVLTIPFDPEAINEGLIYRIAVKGLSYQDSTKEIIYQNTNGSTIACVAAVSAKRNPTRYSMKETKHCSFITKDVTRDIDDGFYIKKVKFLELYLKTL